MEEKIQYPAIALMVTSGLTMLLQLLNLALQALSIGVGGFSAMQGGAGGQQQAMMNMFSGGFGMVIGVFSLIASGVIFFGAMKMYKFENYGLAMTAAALACVPCFSCCCIGVPFGIWAIVALQDPIAKESFR